jgi:hypothetical protein
LGIVQVQTARRCSLTEIARRVPVVTGPDIDKRLEQPIRRGSGAVMEANVILDCRERADMRQRHVEHADFDQVLMGRTTALLATVVFSNAVA